MRWYSWFKNQKNTVEPRPYTADASECGDVSVNPNRREKDENEVAELSKDSNDVKTFHVIKISKKKLRKEHPEKFAASE